ncbi:unnamed protein product [Lepeophtheirus salmonis]|uniref:(salmon louse) hypothetical protein n=1 Tax=Lepeophtheirus salmonis TaxID=72036 RepID=A0A7R8HA72_LEPSM|nr:unnamed protein product [Lepeophtheirus salmonis]CAF2971766.1 unnamed protein product [Lepeophtheirus salmonis]
MLVSNLSRFAVLLIEHEHARLLHSGPATTLASLLSPYWIVRGRQLVNSIIRQCVRCLRSLAKRSPQNMGDLPVARENGSFAQRMITEGSIEEHQGSWIGNDIEGEKLDKNGKKKISTSRDEEKGRRKFNKKNRSTRVKFILNGKMILKDPRKELSPDILHYEELLNSLGIPEDDINCINDCKRGAGFIILILKTPINVPIKFNQLKEPQNIDATDLRLPNHIKPKSYDIKLSPKYDGTDKLSGVIKIEVECVMEGSTNITLHAKHINITHMEMIENDSMGIIDIRNTSKEEMETDFIWTIRNGDKSVASQSSSSKYQNELHAGLACSTNTAIINEYLNMTRDHQKFNSKAAIALDFRLPHHIQPTSYDIQLSPQYGESNKLSGIVKIEVECVMEGSKNITLHSKLIHITRLLIKEKISGNKVKITNLSYGEAGTDLWSCKFGNPKCVNISIKAVEEWMKDINKVPNVDIFETLVCTAIQEGNESMWDFVASQSASTNNPNEFIASLACSKNVSIIEKYLHMTRENQTFNSKASIVYDKVCETQIGRSVFIDFLKVEFDQIMTSRNTFLILSVRDVVYKVLELSNNSTRFEEVAKFMKRNSLFSKVEINIRREQWIMNQANVKIVNDWIQENITSF